MNYEKYSKIHTTKSEHGYILWRYGTDENVEIFDIGVVEKRKGYGREILRLLLKELNPPKIIFGFTKENNKEARAFYSAVGFNLSKGIDDNMLFWQFYENIVNFTS